MDRLKAIELQPSVFSLQPVMLLRNRSAHDAGCSMLDLRCW
ncbi:MAG: hypothetical protein AB1797_03585 [bacterium]